MKKTILLLLVIIAFIPQTFACTTFFINKNGQLIFGRNYDWISDAGMVCSNLRGLGKTSMIVADGSTARWVAKYGSITFNQFGKELPTGGMNEKGLVVELMWAEGSKYPYADKRPALNVLQWIQYQLDNSAVIDDVIASDNAVRISVNNPPIHYLIADANGNAATIEFLNGHMVVHRGNDLLFPVLTNHPYDQSVETAKEANVLSGNTSFSFQDNSLQRFTKACSMVRQYQENDISKPAADYAFDILNSVAQDDFTKWSIVYDIKNKQIYFKTAGYRDVKFFSLASFDFACTAHAKVINMNQAMKGNINSRFADFSNAINRQVMEKAIKESKPQVSIDNKEREYNLSYAAAIGCAE